MTDAIDKELVDRMVHFVRMVSGMGADSPYFNLSSLTNGARDIVALLPKPIDPDLIEARRVNAEIAVKIDKPITAELYRDGRYDSTESIKAVLAGIKLGRKLAEEGR